MDCRECPRWSHQHVLAVTGPIGGSCSAFSVILLVQCVCIVAAADGAPRALQEPHMHTTPYGCQQKPYNTRNQFFEIFTNAPARPFPAPQTKEAPTVSDRGFFCRSQFLWIRTRDRERLKNSSTPIVRLRSDVGCSGGRFRLLPYEPTPFRGLSTVLRLSRYVR